MRILFFIDGMRSGGKERQLAALMKALAERKGVEMVLAVMNRDIYYQEVLELGIEVHFLTRSKKRDYKAAWELLRLCRAWKPDILHAWDSLTAFYALPSVFLSKVKFINGSIRHAATPHFPKKFWWVTRLTYPFSHRVVSNSLAGLAAHGQAPSRKFRRIVNGFDHRRIVKLAPPEELRRSLNVASPKLVGMVANFEDRKDYFTFIGAAQAIVDQRDDVAFIAVGDGKNFQATQDATPSRYSDKILFPGRRRDVESIVALLDVACLINNTQGHGEGVSNSIMEYMALGKPVIATDSGGNREIVADGETGFIIEPFAKAALVEKIMFLLDHPEQAREMGARGRERLAREFSLDGMVQNYLDLYKELAPEKQAPSSPTNVAPPTPATESDPKTGQAPDGLLRVALIGDVALHGLFCTEKEKNFGRLAAAASLLNQADFVLANLETPAMGIEPGDAKKEKQFGSLRGSENDVIAEVLPLLRISAVSLANNHISDYFSAGVNRTTLLLQSLGIRHTGAGTLPEELEPVVLEKNGLRVAFMAYVHSDTHPLSDESQGILLNMYDESAIIRSIRAARRPDTLIIVSVHWGVDYSFYPSVAQQQSYLRLAEAGAHVVMGHHPHTIQPFEKRRGCYIFYSLGGLCFGDFIYEGQLRSLKRKTKKSILPILCWNPRAEPALTLEQCHSLKEWPGNRVTVRRRSLLGFLARKRRYMAWRRFKIFAWLVRIRESFIDRIWEYFFGYYRKPLRQLFSFRNFSKIRYSMRDYISRKGQ